MNTAHGCKSYLGLRKIDTGSLVAAHLLSLVLLTSSSVLVRPAWGQTGSFFKENEVKESALVDALTPEIGLRLRSIRVQSNSVESPSPSASLLITFQTNSSLLTEEAKTALTVVARALRSDGLTEYAFAIEGHADPRGTKELNQRLSQARASSVVDYLATVHGIERARLLPVGKGESEPANPSIPEAPENRRVTIKTMSR